MSHSLGTYGTVYKPLHVDVSAAMFGMGHSTKRLKYNKDDLHDQVFNDSFSMSCQ